MGIMDHFLKVVIRREREQETYKIPMGALLRSTAYDTGSPRARLVVLGEGGTPPSDDVSHLEEVASEERLDEVEWLSEIVSSQSEVIAALWVEDVMVALDMAGDDVDRGALTESISEMVTRSALSIISVLNDIGVIEASQERR